MLDFNAPDANKPDTNTPESYTPDANVPDTPDIEKQLAIKRGTCSFCGIGGGYLGEQGDESTQVMHSAVKVVDSDGHATYHDHPNAYGDFVDGKEWLRQHVTWCGNCVGGLAHKYQRFDDTNLHALVVSGKVRFELDGIRWTHWEERSEGFRKAHPADDPAIHMDKLRLQRDLEDMKNEQFRRAGFDLTTRGWRI